MLAQTLSVFVRRTRIRAADLRRQPVGPDGIVPGAHGITHVRSATHAALLVHGFGDTPQTLRALAQHLADTEGWSVHAPLLPGHGRTLAAFDASTGDQWLGAVRDAYDALTATHRTVVLVGLSMGGALATIQAARCPSLPALVLLAPYLTPTAGVERLAPMAGIVRWITPYLKGGDRTASIFDPDARMQSLGYGATPVRQVQSLVSVAHDARQAAGAILAPTLLIHSRTDYRNPLRLAATHEALFHSARPCVQQWLDGCGHVITVDYRRQTVFEETASWLRTHAGDPRQDGPVSPTS